MEEKIRLERESHEKMVEKERICRKNAKDCGGRVCCGCKYKDGKMKKTGAKITCHCRSEIVSFCDGTIPPFPNMERMCFYT